MPENQNQTGFMDPDMEEVVRSMYRAVERIMAQLSFCADRKNWIPIIQNPHYEALSVDRTQLQRERKRFLQIEKLFPVLIRPPRENPDQNDYSDYFTFEPKPYPWQGTKISVPHAPSFRFPWDEKTDEKNPSRRFRFPY